MAPRARFRALLSYLVFSLSYLKEWIIRVRAGISEDKSRQKGDQVRDWRYFYPVGSVNDVVRRLTASSIISVRAISN